MSWFKIIQQFLGLITALASILFLIFLTIFFFIEPRGVWELYENRRIISGLEIVLGLNAAWVLSVLIWKVMKEALNKLKK